MTRILLIVICGLFLAGCAVAPPPTPSTINGPTGSDSLALQVMQANGYSAGLKDVEVDLPKETSSAGLTHTLDALLLREHLLGRATPLPGVSNSAMSAFFVLELLNDQTYLPRHGMWMPVWMPRHLARDPLEAGIRIFWLIGSYHDDGTNHQLSGLPG